MPVVYDDERLTTLERAGWTCEYRTPSGVPCIRTATQVAHMIPQRKHLVKRHGVEVIHSRHNLRAACCLDHNARMQLPSWEWDEHAEYVRGRIANGPA